MIASRFQPPTVGITPQRQKHRRIWYSPEYQSFPHHPSLFLLHHSTTTDYLLYIGSSLVYICIIEYNGPLFLLVCVTLPATGPFYCRVE